MRRIAFCLIALFPAGCGDGRHDAKTPGEPIGNFAMTGKLERDDCEAAVLGVVDPWQFELRLSRLASDLYWLNGREAISGVLASDQRSFRFDTAIDVTLEPARRGRPACTLSRRDSAAGRLSPSAENAANVEGDIAFIYEVKEQSECANIIGVPGGFATLPCRVEFSLSGARLEDDGGGDR